MFAAENISFVRGNGIRGDLPEADLLICKDVLQHLPNEDVFLLINQFHTFKFCLITIDVNPVTLTSQNPDITCGGYRYVDLTAHPFLVEGIKVLSYSLDQGLWVETKQVLLIVNNNL